MQANGFPPVYLDALHQLTATGRAQVYANEILSPVFDSKKGTGQGDPASADRFIIGTDPVLRALDRATRAFQFVFRNGKDGDIPLPPSGFADDHLACLSLSNAEQLGVILDVYNV